MYVFLQRAYDFLFRWRMLLGIVLLLAILAIAVSPVVDLPPRLLTVTLALLLVTLCATISGMWEAVLPAFLFRSLAEAAATPIDLWPAAESTTVRLC